MKAWIGLILGASVFFSACSNLTQPPSKALLDGGTEQARVPASGLIEAYGRLPMRFEANQGQAGEEVEFISRGSGYALLFARTEVVLGLHDRTLEPGLPDIDAGAIANTTARHALVRLRMLGGDPDVRVTGEDRLPGNSNYFIGNDSSSWHRNIENYAVVRYHGVYPGIDLVFRGNQAGQVEYDFIVAPGVDPGLIRMGFAGAGATLDDQGNLILHTPIGDLIQHAPFIFQDYDGVQKRVEGGFERQQNGAIGFKVAEYDANRPLVIDPVIRYSSYLGGGARDAGYDIAVDEFGNAYVTGTTASLNFPTNPLQADPDGSLIEDIFVAKLSGDGTTLEYSNYLGGNGADVAYGIAVDAFGSAYITGSTGSTDFPTNPPQSDPDGTATEDAFVAKFSADGSVLVYSNYLGGNGADIAHGIAVDGSGSAYVTGSTASTDFPTEPLQSDPSGAAIDAFVTKLSADGSTLVYSNYLGGSDTDIAYGIAVDTSGSAYVTGSTASTDFPTEPLQTDPSGAAIDAFVTKLSADGSTLVYSNYLGGSDTDIAYGIAVDAGGSAYITGSTASADFPTLPPQAAPSAPTESAFIAKINSDGSALTYSNYLGGSGADIARAVAVDGNGAAYIAGETASTDFPTNAALLPVQGAYGGDIDAFVAQFGTTGAVVHSTYLGGSGRDVANGLAVDVSGNVYVTGETESLDYPTGTVSLQAVNAGGADAFVSKISGPAADLWVSQTDSPDPVMLGGDVTYSIIVTNNGPDDADAIVLTDTLPVGSTLVSAVALQGGTCTEVLGVVECDLAPLLAGTFSTVEVTVTPISGGLITNSASVAANQYDPDTLNNTDSETTQVDDNAAPVAGDDAYIVDQDSTGNVLDVKANDSDPDGDASSTGRRPRQMSLQRRSGQRREPSRCEGQRQRSGRRSAEHCRGRRVTA
jgi:uncharacterized repeat protein (TIGR01451 family)